MNRVRRPPKRKREDIRKYYQDSIRETIMASKSLRKVRRTQKLGHDSMITILDKQNREIQDQDKMAERIGGFFTDLTDRELSTICHIDPK